MQRHLKMREKQQAFLLESTARRITSQGQIKHPSSACALADKSEKQLPRNAIKIGQTNSNHTSRVVFQKSDYGNFKSKAIWAPQLTRFGFFSLYWIISALFEIAGLSTPTKTYTNSSCFRNGPLLLDVLVQLLASSTLPFMCCMIRGRLKMSKSGRKYISKSAEVVVFFQFLLYLLFISGISLAFRIAELSTEFSSMIQSLLSCESCVNAQDSSHILWAFTPVCYSALVNIELHFFGYNLLK